MQISINLVPWRDQALMRRGVVRLWCGLALFCGVAVLLTLAHWWLRAEVRTFREASVLAREDYIARVQRVCAQAKEVPLSAQGCVVNGALVGWLEVIEGRVPAGVLLKRMEYRGAGVRLEGTGRSCALLDDLSRNIPQLTLTNLRALSGQWAFVAEGVPP